MSHQLLLPENQTLRQQKKPRPIFPGRAAMALFIFGAIFFGLPFCLISRSSQEILLLSNDPRDFSKRIERYLISGNDSETVILGSSTGILPSFLCDRPFWFRSGRGLTSIDEIRHRFNDLVPRYFVDELRKVGFASPNAVNLSMPTSDVTDEKLVLKKLIRFAKHPKTIVLCISVRDFAVYPWIGGKTEVSPVYLSVNDINIAHEALAGNHFIRYLSIKLRQGTLEHAWNASKLLFTSSLAKLSLPAVQWAKRNSLLPKDTPEYKEPCNTVISDINQVMKNSRLTEQVETAPLTTLLTQWSPKFASEQETSLMEIARILKQRGIKLIIAETPLNPEVKTPERLQALYRKAIEKSATLYGAKLCPTPEFGEDDYLDAFHLDRSGGQKFFHNLANFMAKESL